MKQGIYLCKMGFAQSYHYGRIVQDAKTCKKISFFLRKRGLDPLRRPVPFSTVLQKFRKGEISKSFYDKLVLFLKENKRIGYFPKPVPKK